MRTEITSACDCWYLEGFVDESRTLRRIPVTPFPFQIGRRRNLALVIPSDTVSKTHAEIDANGRTLLVRDLGSTNGTFVNGERIIGERVLQAGDVLHFAKFVFRIDRGYSGDSELTNPTAVAVSSDSRHRLVVGARNLRQLLSWRAVAPHYQPIIDLRSRAVLGYEVLGRGDFEGLPTSPAELFQIAEMLGREVELSEIFRIEGVRVGKELPGPPMLFVNTHPAETKDICRQGLLESLRRLRAESPSVPLTLEVHERAITDPVAMRNLRIHLAELDIELAYDDFGAGQARLLEVSDVPPDYLKFDATLIRDIDSAAASRQQMLETLVRMVHDLGIAALAEGVETPAEAQVCTELGFHFAQGYHYGRPAPAAELLSTLSC